MAPESKNWDKKEIPGGVRSMHVDDLRCTPDANKTKDISGAPWRMSPSRL